MDDDTPITWSQLRRVIGRAGETTDIYSDSRDPHEEIAQGTAAVTLAHLEAALDDERQRVELQEGREET